MNNQQQHMPLGTNLDGQPTGTESGVGQPGNMDMQNGQPQGEPVNAGIDEKTYKNIQSAFSKATVENKGLKEQLASLEKFGGTAKAVEWMDYFQTNTEFQEFVSQQRDKQQGISTEQSTDPAFQEAQQIVRKIAQEESRAITKNILGDYHNRINPILQQQKEQTLAKAETDMDDEYPGWREHKKEMLGLSNTLPSDEQDAPDFGVYEKLLIHSLAQKKGEMKRFMANAHNEKLKQRTQFNVERPIGNTNSGADKRPTTVKEALELAIKHTGFSGDTL